MIFGYCDKDSGEYVQMYRLARAFSAKKKEKEVILLNVISRVYDNIAAAVLRHAEFPQVRQSQ